MFSSQIYVIFNNTFHKKSGLLGIRIAQIPLILEISNPIEWQIVSLWWV